VRVAQQVLVTGAALTAPRGLPRGGDRAFYVPPSPLGPGAPGTLLRAEPMVAHLIPGVRLRASATRVLYRSTSATGEPTAVSGVVFLPPGPHAGPLPLVAYAVGTHGMSDGSAPSRLLARGLDYEAGLIAMGLARGWAVAVTDYQGLGTPGDHPYLVGRALGRNVLDVLRVARELHPDVLPADGPAAVMGYSEGGVASAWAAQLQPSYAPEVPLRAAVVGAAVADLELAAERTEGTFFSFFAAYGALGYAAAYPELDLERVLTDRGRQVVEEVRHRSVVESILWGPHFIAADDLTEPNVLTIPAWRRRLRENRLGTIAPDCPVLLHHSRRDQIVDYGQALQLRERWQAGGTPVELHAIGGAVDHLSAALPGMSFAVPWLGRHLTPASASASASVAGGRRRAAGAARLRVAA
jgi:alpha-beta hydrolase superfamily lysophospholipase